MCFFQIFQYTHIPCYIILLYFPVICFSPQNKGITMYLTLNLLNRYILFQYMDLSKLIFSVSTDTLFHKLNDIVLDFCWFCFATLLLFSPVKFLEKGHLNQAWGSMLLDCLKDYVNDTDFSDFSNLLFLLFFKREFYKRLSNQKELSTDPGSATFCFQFLIPRISASSTPKSNSTTYLQGLYEVSEVTLL